MRRAKPSNRLFYGAGKAMAVAMVFAFAFVLWFAQSARTAPWQGPILKMWMLDVGQGDAFFIEFPSGEQALIDGGPSNAVLSKLGNILPPWDRSLDAVFLTHPDADHITGLVSVLDNYNVNVIYESGAMARTPQAEAFEERFVNKDTERKFVSSGDEIWFGEAVINVLWPQESFEGKYPGNTNDTSLNLLLQYGGTSVLLTGDSSSEIEKSVGPLAGDVDVLKVGHHGSAGSTSYDFLSLTKPEFTLVSVGEGNYYGLPHPMIIDRLIQFGARVFRTDFDGDVLLVSDGGEPMVISKPLPY
jgi:competence protein ComEC